MKILFLRESDLPTIADALEGAEIALVEALQTVHSDADPEMLALAHDELNVIRRTREKITRPKGRT